jgi:hypothetical protein
VTVSPATTGSGEATFRTQRSARCDAVAATVEVLGPVAPTGSGVVMVNDAVFDNEPVNVDASNPTTVMVVEPPTGSEAIEHVTVVVPPHEPGAVDALVNVTPVGRTSETEMADASDGPWFVTRIDQATGWPATRGEVLSVLVISTSASARTITGAVAAAGVGSGVLLDAVALFVSVEPGTADASTWATTVKVVEPVGARSVSAHDTLPPWSIHEAELETKVSPIGRRSLTTTSAADDGPLFVTENV